jgi:hypothetical protein
MATMGNYCKAYPINRFSVFPQWGEKAKLNPVEAHSEIDDTSNINDYLFLQESLIVTSGVFLDEDIVFDQVTPEWEEFCKNELGFEIPDFAKPQINTEQP